MALRGRRCYYICMKLDYFKLYHDVPSPFYATKSSACFDIHAYFKDSQKIKVVDENNYKFDKSVSNDSTFSLHPWQRALIPTGLIFNIPEGHSVRIHPRSGMSFKSGVILGNCEGIIDEDYVEQVFVILYNITEHTFMINSGDRICQGEVVVDTRCVIKESLKRPIKKTLRDGGFGSTGK